MRRWIAEAIGDGLLSCLEALGEFGLVIFVAIVIGLLAFFILARLYKAAHARLRKPADHVWLATRPKIERAKRTRAIHTLSQP